MELLEVMSEVAIAKIREAAKGPARYIKLWENLSIDILGPSRYRRHLVRSIKGRWRFSGRPATARGPLRRQAATGGPRHRRVGDRRN